MSEDDVSSEEVNVVTDNDNNEHEAVTEDDYVADEAVTDNSNITDKAVTGNSTDKNVSVSNITDKAVTDNNNITDKAVTDKSALKVARAEQSTIRGAVPQTVRIMTSPINTAANRTFERPLRPVKNTTKKETRQ